MGKSRTKKNVKSKGKNGIDGKRTDYIFLVLTLIYVLIIPFYRGLFFRENYMPAVAAISLIFGSLLIYRFSKKDFKIISTYLDLVVLAIPLCYLLSFVFGVNSKNGFDLFLLYIGYFMAYKIGGELTKNDEKKRKIIINTVILSTYITALTSILTLSELLSLNGVVVNNRIFGLYQYTNTTASVFSLGIVLAVNSLIMTDDIRFKLIYQGIMTTLLATLILTLSKGGLFALIVVLFVNFLIVNAGKKVSFILNILISAVSNFLFIYKFYNKVNVESANIMSNYLISILICFMLTIALHYIQRRFFKDVDKKKINVVLVALLAVFVSIAAFLYLAREPVEFRLEHLAGEDVSWKNNGFYIEEVEKEKDYIIEFDVRASIESPHSYGIIIRSYDEKNEFEELLKVFEPTGDVFAHKSFEFTTLVDTHKLLFLLYNYETDSYTVYTNVVLKDLSGNIIKRQERFKYIPDVIANRFKNFGFESSSISSRVRFVKDGIKIFKDHFIIGAGGGAWNNLYKGYQASPYNTTEVHNFYVQYATEVGILGLLALFAVILQLLYGFIMAVRNKSGYLAVYLGVILMLIHSAIDFNLSLPAVAIVLWTLIGLLNNDESIKRPEVSYGKALSIGLVLASVTVFFVTSRMYYGMRLGNEASKIVNEDMDAAIPMYEKAMKFDKYNSDYRVDYAQIMIGKYSETNDIMYLNSMFEQIEKVREMEPYNYKYNNIILKLLLGSGQLDKAVALADEKVKNEPLVSNSYVTKIDVNYEIAKYYFSNSEHAKAIPYLEKILETEKEYETAQEYSLENIPLEKKYKKDMYGLARNWIEQANRIESKKK